MSSVHSISQDGSREQLNDLDLYTLRVAQSTQQIAKSSKGGHYDKDVTSRVDSVEGGWGGGGRYVNKVTLAEGQGGKVNGRGHWSAEVGEGVMRE